MNHMQVIGGDNREVVAQVTQDEHSRRPAPMVRYIQVLWLTIAGLCHRMLRRRVPVLLQMNAVECGAACLAMILSYHGRKTSSAEISDQAGLGRDGLSALEIVKTARQYGLRVRPISLRDNDFRAVSLPAIVHWQFNHFVIVERWGTRSVDIVDPATGRRRVSSAEFEENFTGVVIMLEPGTQFVRHTTSARVTLYGYAKHYVRRAPIILLQIAAATLLLQGLGLALPLATGFVIDAVIPHGQVSLLLLLGAAAIVVVIAEFVTSLLRTILLTYLQTRIDLTMLPNFFEHMLSLPHSFFQKRSSGDIMARVSSNASVREIVSNQLISTCLDSCTIIISLVILFCYSTLFGAAVLAIGLLQVLLLLCTNRRMRTLARQDLESAGRLQGYVGEMLTGIGSIKAAGAEQRAFEQWSNLFVDQLNISIRRTYFSSAIATCLVSLQALAPLALLWLGAQQVMSHHLLLGAMVGLSTLGAYVLSPLSSLVRSAQQIQLVNSHLERIADVLDARPEQNVQTVQQPPRLSGRVSLDHVGFRYDAHAPHILKDISLHIQPRQKIAIVGRTGSGKSTLGKLLLGLIIPNQGEISYDGIPLRFLNYQAVRAQFGVVMQDASVFSGTIRQNIAFNAPGISIEAVMQAARLADLHEDIQKMPMGYETFVSEGGSALSGGQRQRLALARALASHPAILLLDEATSALDVVTEQHVERNLRALPCTQIIIAHRLSTIRNADQILVLDDGRLIEQGTHQQLLQRDSYYARLIQNQLASGEIA
ncbi:peptidase domain-containing ABC transporter [Dictyobacter aurantiacus]|uniref:NHLP family bacteriocin export ABC transporter peptidase/permease/ATPase n=1 Tax=Dictyobacter aurantiacus TaxID=1936993 RepID=A0A401ZIN3_9CHLR|nr:peptidase domain-containing ABC transporter [Dictyobacter aurantiacus]GCE06707.1 NHLP family bacteriocin export ABC transporter peptidase/permease/ATPase [Dictyobacter aurantiacus]